MAKKKSIFQKIRNFFLLLLVLLILAVGGLFAAVHFEYLEQAVIEEKLQVANELVGLYKLPLVGYGGAFEYFEVPEGVIWPEPEPEPEPEPIEVATTKPAPPPPQPKQSKEVKISQKDLEAQAAAREAAEKKRISKLARIYDNMKPEEAAKALDSVNLDTVVLILQKMDESNAGKILAKMEPAQVTQMLMDGDRRRL